MSANFYEEWFRGKTVRPVTAQEAWRRKTDQLRSLATSDFAQEIVERFKVPEVEEAETLLKEAMAELDQETRLKIDAAVGKVSLAYQILGFCAGHFSQDSRARAL